MPNQIAAMTFTVSGSIVALLLVVRGRHVSGKDRSATAAAVFGLFLCARYAEVIHRSGDWIFTGGVTFVMVLLAYNSLGFEHRAKVPAD